MHKEKRLIRIKDYYLYLFNTKSYTQKSLLQNYIQMNIYLLYNEYNIYRKFN